MWTATFLVFSCRCHLHVDRSYIHPAHSSTSTLLTALLLKKKIKQWNPFKIKIHQEYKCIGEIKEQHIWLKQWVRGVESCFPPYIPPSHQCPLPHWSLSITWEDSQGPLGSREQNGRDILHDDDDDDSDNGDEGDNNDSDKQLLANYHEANTETPCRHISEKFTMSHKGLTQISFLNNKLKICESMGDLRDTIQHELRWQKSPGA